MTGHTAFDRRPFLLRWSGEGADSLPHDEARDPDDEAAERPLLEAVAEHFGVRLPRHALLNGRLHTVTTRSWTRPPGDGETYLVWSMA